MTTPQRPVNPKPATRRNLNERQKAAFNKRKRRCQRRLGRK